MPALSMETDRPPCHCNLLESCGRATWAEERAFQYRVMKGHRWMVRAYLFSLIFMGHRLSVWKEVTKTPDCGNRSRARGLQLRCQTAINEFGRWKKNNPPLTFFIPNENYTGFYHLCECGRFNKANRQFCENSACSRTVPTPTSEQWEMLTYLWRTRKK